MDLLLKNAYKCVFIERYIGVHCIPAPLVKLFRIKMSKIAI